MIQTVTIFLTLLTDCLFIRLRSRFRLSILFCDILLRSVVLIEYNVSHIYIHSNSTLSSIRTVSNTCRFHSVRYACTRGTYATERTLGEDINLLNGEEELFSMIGTIVQMKEKNISIIYNKLFSASATFSWFLAIFCGTHFDPANCCNIYSDVSSCMFAVSVSVAIISYNIPDNILKNNLNI